MYGDCLGSNVTIKVQTRSRPGFSVLTSDDFTQGSFHIRGGKTRGGGFIWLSIAVERARILWGNDEDVSSFLPLSPKGNHVRSKEEL